MIEYLVCWKRFTVENNIWEKEEDLENAKELVDEFKGRIEAEIRWQERLGKMWKVKLNPNAEKLRRSKLLEKYIVKLL